jgi:hypothetical protein
MRAMFGAAREQIGALCRRLGLAPPEFGDEGAFPGRADAAGTLDQEHRLFDAARARLWMAEEAADAATVSDALSTFEMLGAHPYLLRAKAVGGR